MIFLWGKFLYFLWGKFTELLRPKTAVHEVDRGWTEASGQSGQKSVHLAEKKWRDFSTLQGDFLASVHSVQYEKFRYFSKWLKFLYFFMGILYYYFILDSNKKIYTPCKAVGRDRKIEYIFYIIYMCVFWSSVHLSA